MLWMTILIFSLSHVPASCFEGCTVSFGKRSCQHRMLNGVIVVCDGYGTETQVPRNLPQDTLYLSLTNFNFSRPLVSSDFSRLTTVQCLAIINSRLVGVQNDTFGQFDLLYELALEGTKLNQSHLGFLAHSNFRAELFALSRSPHLTALGDYGAPKTLETLKTLKLDNNRMKTVSKELFTELRNLERLDLSNNRLTGLPWEIFTHLEKLNQLLLAGNHLQAIPDSVRNVFFAVKQLTLANNPLHCNCRLSWLRDFYQKDATDKTVDADHVFCHGPKHTHIARDPSAPENFRCSEPRVPVVTWMETADGRVEMNCTAHADPAPMVTLTVVNVRKRMVIPPSENMAELNTSTPQILVEPGFVVCEAVNSQGSSKVMEQIGPKIELDSFAELHSASVFVTLLSTLMALNSGV